jgi:hypothetical protein
MRVKAGGGWQGWVVLGGGDGGGGARGQGNLLPEVNIFTATLVWICTHLSGPVRSNLYGNLRASASPAAGRKKIRARAANFMERNVDIVGGRGRVAWRLL